MAKHILIADDEAPTRELLAMFFRRAGYTVSTVAQGQEVLPFLTGQTPDLLVLDIDLGDANGIELLCPIKQKMPNLPIIIFTGIKTDEAMIRRAKENGADAFMSKTQPLQSMLDEIRKLLGQ